MGIPSYFVSLLKNNSNLLNKLSPTFIINALYFDSNSIIYDVIKELEDNKDQKSIINNDIYKKVCEKLMFYIKTINPQNEIYISLDGVAPSAKMEQQRQRRYKTQLIRNIKQQIQPSSTIHFNTNQITPGTKFMNELCVYLTKYFQTHIIFNNKNERVNVVLSLSTIPGEGEHKIYNYIRQNHASLVLKYNAPTYSHIIYGLDSDLIMLSLINCDIVNNIYLLREAPHFIDKINKKYSPGTLYYIDFNKIKNIITHDIHQDDYVLISFIIGNDFIPHNPAFTLRNNGLDVILKTYKTLFSKNIGNRNITYLYNNKRTIDITNLKKLFIELSVIEKTHFKDAINRKLDFADKIHRQSNKDMSIDDKLNFIPKINVEKEHSLFKQCNGENAWKKNYYKLCFNVEYNNKDFSNIIENYLDALYWNFDYYTQCSIDVFWKYNYHHAPLLSDVVCNMTDFLFNERFTENNCMEMYKNPIHPQTQLSYVLPKESYGYLKENIKTYIEDNIPELIHHNLEYNYVFSSYLWEGHLDLNYIDIKHLNDKLMLII
jgi:5'-3' exonuclease